MKRQLTASLTSVAMLATLAPMAVSAQAPEDTGAPVQVVNLTVVQEGQGWNALLDLITQDFATTHEGSTYTVEYSPQEQHSQKVQLTAAQGALPLLYTAPELDVIAQLEASGYVLDLEPELERLGVLDRIEPGALSATKTAFGGKLLALPMQLNIEGFWYNKQLFEQHGVQPPTTWGELIAAGETFQAQGIQPLAASGIQGWPITRLISGYIFRSLGPDAMQQVDAGTASLTDPGYVAAAQAVADLGAKGFFGQGVSDLDYDPAMDLFLQGQAAMFYMGSWAVANFNDPERNLIGAENVGFFPFPNVEGGLGDSTQTPMNIGATTLWNKALYDDAAAQWLKAVAQSYGNVALAEQGQVTGFVVDAPPAELPALTQLVTAQIAATTTSVTWFEQLFTARELSAAFQNVVPLVTGQMSAEDYMQSVVDAGS